jgi:hypothetical protein
MSKTLLSTFSLAALVFASGCNNAGTHEREGTKVGALAGAVIGAVIGHQSGEAGAGAALGAAAGAITGSAVGANKDREQDKRYERGTVRAQPARDQYGYSLDDYMRLMTNEEMDILQARGDARPEVALGVLLTDQEKANLRRRQVADREIGR